MLRRKVKKILLFYAIADPTTDKDVSFPTAAWVTQRCRNMSNNVK